MLNQKKLGVVMKKRVGIFLVACGAMQIQARVQLISEKQANQPTVTISRNQICNSGKSCLGNDIIFGTSNYPNDSFNFDKLFGFTSANEIVWQEYDPVAQKKRYCGAKLSPAV